MLSSPLRISVVYLAFGLGALLVSDLYLTSLLSEPLLSRVQAVKGLVEVLFTVGLIYALTSASQATHRETMAELERHRDELRVLHRLLRHNLRNDLNLIRGEAERLRDAVDGDAELSCETVLETAQGIVDYTERARTIRKLAELETRRVDLASLVPASIARADCPDGVEVRTEIPDSAPVRANELFEAALAELVTNAAVHAGDDPTVDIAVDPDCAPRGKTLVEVRDDGPGLPEFAEAVLRGEERDQLVHMDGLGLWLAYLTVVESGGEFEIPDDPEGTTIRMYLPTTRIEADGGLPVLGS